MIYTPNPQHRNAAFANVKSQWSIPIVDETNSFNTAHKRSWVVGAAAWGLHLVQNLPTVLGTTPKPQQFPVQIAKFVGDSRGNWHGYPAAHWLSPYDRPALTVLERWQRSGLINKAKMAKIYRCKRCSL